MIEQFYSHRSANESLASSAAFTASFTPSFLIKRAKGGSSMHESEIVEFKEKPNDKLEKEVIGF